MYLEHWGLREPPFSNVPDSRFFYQSPTHRASLTRLAYLCAHQHGAGVLLGPFGSGKTLLAFALLNTINAEDQFRTVYIRNPSVSPLELLQLMAAELGAPSLPPSKSEALKTIESRLYDNILDGRHTLIVIDEAHAIKNTDTFEEVRLLLNFQLEDAHLVTLILAGQPGLEATVDQNKPLAQRVNLVTRLQPLNIAETEAYIGHRIGVAGGQETLFQAEAVSVIHRISGGLPRRINHLCDGSLLEGSIRKAERIDPPLVREAARHLRLTSPAGKALTPNVPHETDVAGVPPSR